MIEFSIVGPIITLLGLAVLQYGMLFFAKNQINHAAFMAARAGATGNARMATVQTAYVKALIPLYGGGRSDSELAAAYAKAVADTAGHLQVQILNPTTESFDDFNDPALENRYGARAISNSGQAHRSPIDIKPASGQNIQDANLIKLRITHGYEPKVPLINLVYRKY
ncbi:MAG: pilus assembly protein, partial [Pseudomonadota bacterium]|nr:pilus assembly protein [Pseudomonadota bacterium]